MTKILDENRKEKSVQAIVKIRIVLASIRFEHTVFALPFAYLGMVLAATGMPSIDKFIWITLAMGSARTLAMTSNRIIDRKLDADNPRTANRALPSGDIRLRDMIVMAVVSLIIFELSAWQLNPLALLLSPVAVIVVIGYPYTKRFTWASHFVLGWADGIAPVGGWIGVTGSFSWEPVILAFAVATWISGFDLLYACQDRDFDVKAGLHSIPQKFGIVAAMRWAKFMHILTVGSLGLLGMWLALGILYYVGIVVAGCLLYYEHRLVSPTDLSRLNLAFFNINGYLAVAVFVFTLASIYV